MCVASAELKEDIKGQKEFVSYLTQLQLQRADLQERINQNKAWIVSSCSCTIKVGVGRTVLLCV